MKFIFLEAVQNFGGAQKSTIELIKRLQNDDHSILLIDFWGSDKELLNVAESENINLKILNKQQRPDVIKNTNSKLLLFKNYYLYFFKWLLMRKKISRIIKDFNPDIIIVNNTKTLSILKKSKNYKIIFFVRTWFATTKLSKLKHFILKFNTDVFFAVSHSTRQAIFSKGLAKFENIFVLPNAINLKNIRQGIHGKYSDKLIILHCGGFLPTKGQHISIEIANKLKTYLDFKLILVGPIYEGLVSKNYYSKILQKITEYDLQEKIEIHTKITNASSFFEECDILIHPTLTEGLPRVIMEAMAHNKPVIANGAGGVTDFILNGFTGLLTTNNEPEEYVEKILLLRKNRKYAEKLIDNAYRLLEMSYTEKNQTEQLYTILNKFMA